VLDQAGGVLLERKVSTTPKTLRETFGAMPRSRIALETGTHSPWVSRLLTELGDEAIVAHARNVRLIGESRRKDDRLDARTLARLVRIDPQLLRPVKHRSAEDNARGMKPKAAQDLSPELKSALEPLMRETEFVSERICEYDQLLESMVRNRYPEAEWLKQIKGVGTRIALTYMLTMEDPHRFRKSRDAACYVGLQPGRRNSGQSEPQMHISKEGDPYLRALLVQAAHHVLGPWGVDSDLRRWGMKLAEHGGKRGKKRAVIAVARKLAVLLHRLWVSGDVYVPLQPSGRATLPSVA
jgi:transposase